MSHFYRTSARFWMEYISTSDELFKKHGLKRLGGWVVPTEHKTVGVFEAPSPEAFQGFIMEPICLVFSAYETMEVKIAFSMEEVA